MKDAVGQAWSAFPPKPRRPRGWWVWVEGAYNWHDTPGGALQCERHLFNAGLEVATNVKASKRDARVAERRKR